MKLLRLEFYKTRRRKLWLVVLLFTLAQILWTLWAMSRMDASDRSTGWLWCLNQLPMLNAIFLPIMATVLASRISDLEHKGQTLKLLETLVSSGGIFNAKLICGFFYLTGGILVQNGTILCAGLGKGFQGPLPIRAFGLYLLSTLAVTWTVYLLQLILSLLILNQMIPLLVGVAGGFIGVFSLYLPTSIGKLLLWGYYAALGLVGMDWDKPTRTVTFFRISWDTSAFFQLIAFSLLLYLAGRILFYRKEL